jgi:uncharacterized membrane protein
MNIEPILNAPLPIQIHLATVVPAFLIGTWQIVLSTKGARLHRFFGYVYLILMSVTAISTIWISEVWPNGPLLGFSFIHLFIPLTFYGVYGALRGAWTGDIAMHKRAMIGLYLGGILIAGAITFMPGRLMHEVFFGV